MTDAVELLVGGRIYGGWTEFRVTRAMDRAAGDCDLSVSERWPSHGEAWRIQSFDEVELRLDHDLLVIGTEFTLGQDGRRTRLTLTPREALLPEPLRPSRGRRRGDPFADVIPGSGRLDG